MSDKPTWTDYMRRKVREVWPKWFKMGYTEGILRDVKEIDRKYDGHMDHGMVYGKPDKVIAQVMNILEEIDSNV